MRTTSSIKNVLVSTIMSIVVILVGFITQRIFVEILGLEHLGVNGLFVNIISMLGIVELGLGSAIVYHLYVPMSARDSDSIKTLIEFYKKGYRVIASVVAGIALSVMPFLGAIVGKVNIPESIYIIYLLFIMDVVCSYLLVYKRSILYADQKNYIINFVHIGYTLAMNGLQIAILLFMRNYYLYLIIKVIMRVIENVIITTIVNKRYPFLNNGEALPIDDNIKQGIVKKIKALFMHKIGDFVVLGSDNIVISIFLGIKTVGLYSSYYLVTSALSSIISQAFTSVTASVGNLLVGNNHKKSFDIYNKVCFANFWLASVASIGFIVTMNSFVKIWLGDKYILSIGVLLALGLNLYLQLTRSGVGSFKDAAGIFYEDRFVPIVESVVNIVFSVVLLQFFGLAGVFMGTICSNLVLHLFSYPKFVYTRLFKRSYRDYYIEFIKYLIFALVAGVITFVISRTIVIDSMFAHFVINVALSVIVPSLLFYIIYRNSDEFIYFKNLIIKIFAKVKGRKYMK
jgi:O-antigen/teichoic acid export membrane protein